VRITTQGREKGLSKKFGAGRVAQVAEGLPNKCEALSSIPSTKKKYKINSQNTPVKKKKIQLEKCLKWQSTCPASTKP
jgi:hypothetical protein